MKIYIAAHASNLAEGVGKQLRAEGLEVVSTWHKQPLTPGELLSAEQKKTIANKDLSEVRESDAVLLIAGDDKYSGGKFIEAGYALGLGKRVFVLGRRENVMVYADGCEDAAELLASSTVGGTR